MGFRFYPGLRWPCHELLAGALRVWTSKPHMRKMRPGVHSKNPGHRAPQARAAPPASPCAPGIFRRRRRRGRWQGLKQTLPAQPYVDQGFLPRRISKSPTTPPWMPTSFWIRRTASSESLPGGSQGGVTTGSWIWNNARLSKIASCLSCP